MTVVPHDLTVLASEVGTWHKERWPQQQNEIFSALKFAEEAGEVAGSIIKKAEGRKDTRDVADEIGDAVIALAALCSILDIPFGVAVGVRWFEISRREWP